ncbi:aquaporin-9 [Ramicandelaber brevisporus]|nr:aquaporin-9 [Ramicandelaber brevisporus]
MRFSTRLRCVLRQHREYLAEFFGTFILLFLGDSVVAMAVLHSATLPGASAYLTMAIGWAVALICAMCVTGSISGGHYNPAVTITLAVHRGFPWRKVPGFICAQIVGAFAGAALTYAQYRHLLDEYDDGHRQIIGPKGSAGIFTTFRSESVSNFGAAWNEFVTTAMLVVCVLGCSDPRNTMFPTAKTPALIPNASACILIGVVMCIGMGSGFGCSLNPARDLGPRIFTSIAGWGYQVFTVQSYYFWISSVVPVVGAISGGYIYDMLVFYEQPLSALTSSSVATDESAVTEK